MGSSDIYITL